MSRINNRLRGWHDPATGQRGLTYWCQGCRQAHGVRIAGPGSWGFNGDHDAPTFSPSVLTTWRDHSTTPPTEQRCHTYVQGGQVRFLGDCTHALAGQTLPLPQLPDWL